MKIDEENNVKVKTSVQMSTKTPYIYFPKVLFDNGLVLEPGQNVEVCLDKKNKIVYIRYGEAES